MIYYNKWVCYQTKLGSTCRPVYWQANLLTLGRGEGKCSVYCRPTKEFRQLVFKRPKLLEGFQGKVFKDRVREGVMGCVISSWTFFWLFHGEVTGSQHQHSGSNKSGFYMLVGSTQLTSSTWWRFQGLQNSSKDMAQNIIYSPWLWFNG